MKLFSKKIKFLRIDIEYIKKLYDIDKEVYYDSNNKNYDKKPYFGILVTTNNIQYVIPFTSGKEKHLTWENNNSEYIKIIDERVKINEKDTSINFVKSSDPLDPKPYKVILAVLDFRKAIPVKEGLYSDFNFKLESLDSKKTLEKEYNFCKTNQETIIENFSKLYEKFNEKEKPIYKQCDYRKLEKFCENYIVKSLQKGRIDAAVKSILGEENKFITDKWISLENNERKIIKIEEINNVYKKNRFETCYEKIIKEIGDEFKNEEIKKIKKEEIKEITKENVRESTIEIFQEP